MTVTKIINLSNFPVEKTTFFGLIREKGEEQKNLIAYISGWDARFPEAVGKMKQKTVSDLEELDYASCLKYFNAYNLENDNINPIRPLAIKQINELLEDKAGDSPIIKLLKEVGKSQKDALEEDFKSLSEVAPMIFIRDSIESFYLKTLPDYIKEKLDELEPIKFEELDQEKLKIILNNDSNGIFPNFYSVDKVEMEYDLNDFQTSITSGLNDLENLIKSVRDSKKPNVEEAKAELKIYQDTFIGFYPDVLGQKLAEMIKIWFVDFKTAWNDNGFGKYGAIYSGSLNKIKEELEKQKPSGSEELTKLREVWITNFANRVIIESKEYLKNSKELSVDAINEVANSLKVYDDTFAYMFNDFEPSKTNNWWSNLVRPYWKANFFGKWGNEEYKGGIDATALKQLKEYIEGREKEIKDWLDNFPTKDYPNGAEGIQELINKLKESQGKPVEGGESSEQQKETIDLLKNWCVDLVKLVHKYDKNPELWLETPPTPPNSPDVAPNKTNENNEEIPPLENKK